MWDEREGRNSGRWVISPECAARKPGWWQPLWGRKHQEWRRKMTLIFSLSIWEREPARTLRGMQRDGLNRPVFIVNRMPSKAKFGILKLSALALRIPQCLTIIKHQDGNWEWLLNEWVSEVAQSCLNLCNPMDGSPPGSSVHGIFQARVLEWVCHFLLQGIFPTQRSNTGLPHCRQMLYYLSHQGSPKYYVLKHPIVYLQRHWSQQWSRLNLGCSVNRSVVSDSLGLHGLSPTRLLCPWNSPGKITGVDCRALLQGIFPAQGSNTYLLLFQVAQW